MTSSNASIFFQLRSQTYSAPVDELVSRSGPKAGGGRVRATSPGQSFHRLFGIILIMCLARPTTGVRVVGVTMASTGVTEHELLNSHTTAMVKQHGSPKMGACFHQFGKDLSNEHADVRLGKAARGVGVSGSLKSNSQGRMKHLPQIGNSVPLNVSSVRVEDCMCCAGTLVALVRGCSMNYLRGLRSHNKNTLVLSSFKKRTGSIRVNGARVGGPVSTVGTPHISLLESCACCPTNSFSHSRSDIMH